MIIYLKYISIMVTMDMENKDFKSGYEFHKRFLLLWGISSPIITIALMYLYFPRGLFLGIAISLIIFLLVDYYSLMKYKVYIWVSEKGEGFTDSKFKYLWIIVETVVVLAVVIWSIRNLLQ